MPLVYDLLELNKEPAINRCRLEDLLHTPAICERRVQPKDPLCIGDEELTLDFFPRDRLWLFLIKAEAPTPGLQRAQCLLHRLLERPTNRHRLTHRLHLCGESRVRRRELLEGKPRKLRHDIIDRWLEARRCLPRDIIWQLVQCITHCQFRRNLSDWETRCF